MADDPQHIKYIIEAQANEANAEVNKLVGTISMVNDKLQATQKLVSKLLGVNTAQQAAQLGRQLGAIGRGDFDTQLKNAAQANKMADMRADSSTRFLKTEQATTKLLQNQAELAGRFATQYDRIIDMSAKMRKATGADYAKMAAQQKSIIESVSSTLGGRAQETQRAALTRSADMREPTANNRQYETQQYLSRRGLGFDREQANGALAFYDAQTASEKEGLAVAKQRQDLEQSSKKLQTDITAQKKQQDTINKSILNNFRAQNALELKSIPNQADRDRRFNSMMSGYRSGMSGQGLVLDEQPLNDSYARMQAQTRAAEAARAARDTEANSRAAAQAEYADAQKMNRQYDARQRQSVAPEQQALQARARNNAFGGAGLFVTQAQLLSNYASMAGILGTIGYLANYTVQYEASMKELQAISTATNGEMKDLDKTILQLSSDTKFSASDLAKGATLMAQAGLSARQIKEVLPVVSQLAVATGTDFATASDSITSTMAIFDLQTTEAANVANTLTAAMNMSKLSIEKWSLGLQYSGNVAASIGIKYNELAAILSGMANAGIKSGSTLGTGLRQLLLELENPTAKATSVFERVGLSPADLDVQSKGIFEVLQKLKDANLTTADASEAFEVRAVAAFKAISNNLPQIEDLNTNILITNSATVANAQQMDTMSAKWTQFSSGAGAAFYKTTGNIREVIKTLLDVLIQGTKIFADFAPFVQIATTAGIAFLTAWSIQKLIGIAMGIGAMATAMRAAAVAAVQSETAATGIMVAVNALGGPLAVATIAFTLIAGAIQLFQGATNHAVDTLESYREATNRAKGDLDATKETINSLDTAMQDLVNRYGVLSQKESPALRNEITELNARFSQYGLTLDVTGDKIDDVIGKTAAMRQALSATMTVQAQIALAAANSEHDQLALAGAQQLRTGQFGSMHLDKNRVSDLADAVQSFRSDGKTIPGAIQSVMPDIYGLSKFAGAKGYGPGITPDQLGGMDINDALNTQGRLARAQMYLKNQVSMGSKSELSKNELDNYMSDVNYAIQFSSQLINILGGIRNKGSEAKQLQGDVNLGRAGASPGMAAFQSDVDEAKGAMNDRLLSVQSQKGFGKDRIQSDIKGVGDSMAGTLKDLSDRRTSLLQTWITEGLVGTMDEAEKLFRQLPVSDDYAFVQSVVSRDGSKLDANVKKLWKSQLEKTIETANAKASLVLDKAKVPTMPIPEGSFMDDVDGSVQGEAGKRMYVQPTMDKSIHDLNSAFSQRKRAEEDYWHLVNPEAFGVDANGDPTNPSKAAEYAEVQAKTQAQFFDDMAKLYKSYGKEFAIPLNGPDAKAEVLRGQIADLKAKMAKDLGSVDGQSPIEKIQGVLDGQTRDFEQLMDLSAQLKSLTWDDKKWKNAPLDPAMKKQRLADLQSQLQNEEGKGIDHLTNLRDDAAGKQSAAALGAHLKGSMNSFSTFTMDPELTGLDAAQAKATLAGQLMDSIVKDYTAEFWALPANREKRGSQEVQDTLNDKLGQYLVDRAGMVLKISDQMVQNRAWWDQRSVQAQQSVIGSFDNSTNAGGVGSTMRYMAGTDLKTTQENATRNKVAALQDQRSMLLHQQAGYSLAVATGAPDSGKALNDTIVAIRDNVKALTAALDEMAAATGKATAPGPWQLIMGSMRQFMDQEGLLRGGFQQMADSLPQIFGAMQGSIDGALGGIIGHTKDTGDAVKEMVRSILTSLMDMGIKIATNELIQMAFKAFLGAAGVGVSSVGGGISSGAGAMTSGNSIIGSPHAAGGMIVGGVAGRDSVLTPTMPGEFVMKTSAVDMIGADNLAAMNRTGRLATSTQRAVASQKRDPDMVNVYVVGQDTKPSMGPKDVIVTMQQDMLTGTTKKIIKAIAVGAA